jgi:hypothetical protein
MKRVAEGFVKDGKQTTEQNGASFLLKRVQLVPISHRDSSFKVPASG